MKPFEHIKHVMNVVEKFVLFVEWFLFPTVAEVISVLKQLLDYSSSPETVLVFITESMLYFLSVYCCFIREWTLEMIHERLLVENSTM